MKPSLRSPVENPVLVSVRQFRTDHLRLFKGPCPVVLACSGGPDSMALLAAFHVLNAAWRHPVTVVHVNHGLRGRSSDADAAFVEKEAKKRRLAFVVRRVALAAGAGNLEERAREKRYDALLGVAKRRKAALILTAHTLDDQAETVFMNVLRGAGPGGLVGMAPLRALARGVRLARPLLSVAREDIEGFLASRRVPTRTDASNRNLEFRRNWIRNEVFPALEKRAPGLRRRLANMANLFREEELYWEAEISALKKVLLRRRRGGALLDSRGLFSYSAAVQRRILRSAVGSSLLTFDGVERWRRWMKQPPTDGRRWTIKQGWIAERLSKSKGAPTASLFWIGRDPTPPRRARLTSK